MKKAISLLLALALCLSLCACRNEENTGITDSTQEISSTTDTSTETTIESEIKETKPNYIQVELTVDNWSEYYEFEYVSLIKENGFGEIDKWYCVCMMRLKEEYESIFAYASDDLAIEFNYKCSLYNIIRNDETRTFELADKVEVRSERTKVFDLSAMEIVDSASGASLFTSQSAAKISYNLDITERDVIYDYPEDFVATRAVGSIYLLSD